MASATNFIIVNSRLPKLVQETLSSSAATGDNPKTLESSEAM
jgi:hypothetical protein